MNLIEKYIDAFSRYGSNTAFCAGSGCLTYDGFYSLVNGSRQILENEKDFEPRHAVGVFCNEMAETYAAVFAIWFSGCIFVPLNPASPPLFINELIKKHNIRFVFSPEAVPAGIDLSEIKILENRDVISNVTLPAWNWESNQVMYILNTSGSTGTPKNVPITLKNVTAFVEGFQEIYPELNAEDNFLQTYELTADAAFTGYLIPFLIGAAVYTVPAGQFKPFAVARVITEKPVTWVQVTPSLLACLYPFFSSFDLKGIRHFHFGGEALPAGMVEEWRRHIPHAEVSNVYGPTETTITATVFKCMPGEKLMARNNVVSIGKPLKNVQLKFAENNELLIAGEQVMEKYWFTDEEPFVTFPGEDQKFYPTGDLAEQDENGYLYYRGRLDDQVKVSGYRVDLIEVENVIRSAVPEAPNVAATVVEKAPGLNQLVVFIENYMGSEKNITDKLHATFPAYKIPERIITVTRFPLSAAGKVDKKALVQQYLNPRP